MTTLTDRCDEAMARAYILRLSDECGLSPIEDSVMAATVALLAVPMTAARLALLAALDAEGWKLVPLVATDEMIAAVRRLDWKSQTDIDWPDGNAAMLSAAPDALKAASK